MFSNKKTIPVIVAAALMSTHGAIPGAMANGPEQGKSKDGAEAEHMRGDKRGDADRNTQAAEEKSENYGDKAQSALAEAWLDGKLDTTLLLMDEVDSFSIDSKVENGIAYLSGSVDSDIERDLAEEIALSVDGVESVENELEVKQDDEGKSDAPGADERFRNAVKSAALTARIKSELLFNSNVSGLSIDIDSHKDNVTLNGSVDSELSKELAGKIAQNAAGEREVTNNLSIAADS